MIRILCADRIRKRPTRGACKRRSVKKRKGQRRNCVLVKKGVARAEEGGFESIEETGMCERAKKKQMYGCC